MTAEQYAEEHRVTLTELIICDLDKDPDVQAALRLATVQMRDIAHLIKDSVRNKCAPGEYDMGYQVAVSLVVHGTLNSIASAAHQQWLSTQPPLIDG